MVRSAAEQFACQIEKIRSEEGFSGGSVLKKTVKSSEGYKNGPYAYLVSPEEHGREWFYLGKYKPKIDLEERAEMDYNRLMFRLRELGREHRIRNIKAKKERYNRAKHYFTYDTSFWISVSEAKLGNESLPEQIRGLVFGRGACPVNQNPDLQRGKLTKLLLEHLIEEANEIHLPEDETIGFELDEVLQKAEEWGRTPYSLEQYNECVRERKEPNFVN
jgi:hypothetical protein